MKVKWILEFDVPLEQDPIVRDDSKWLHNKLVTIEGLTFVNGELTSVVCNAAATPSSRSPVVYRGSDKVAIAGDVIPERKELDAALDRILARAYAQALVDAATRTGLPDPFTAVRGLLQCQEEFIKDVDGIYEALKDIEAAASTAQK